MEATKADSKGSNGPSIQRVFQGNLTELEGCLGTPISLCNTPLAHSRDVLHHPHTPLAGCLTWDSTRLGHTIQPSSLLLPASPTLHSIISQSLSLVREVCHLEEREDTMLSHRRL